MFDRLLMVYVLATGEPRWLAVAAITRDVFMEDTMVVKIPSWWEMTATNV